MIFAYRSVHGDCRHLAIAGAAGGVFVTRRFSLKLGVVVQTMCAVRTDARVVRQLLCLREIGDDRTIVPALYKPVAGEATLGDQNGNEIPLRTSYALPSVEGPP